MQTQEKIITSIQALSPTHVELINESMNHAGYFEGKESHFKLTLVSSEFEGKRLVGRHQLVYAAVDTLMIKQGGSVYALAIHAYTPEEWRKLAEAAENVPASPMCAGQNVG